MSTPQDVSYLAEAARQATERAEGMEATIYDLCIELETIAAAGNDTAAFTACSREIRRMRGERANHLAVAAQLTKIADEIAAGHLVTIDSGRRGVGEPFGPRTVRYADGTHDYAVIDPSVLHAWATS